MTKIIILQLDLRIRVRNPLFLLDSLFCGNDEKISCILKKDPLFSIIMWNVCYTFFSRCLGKEQPSQDNTEEIYNCFCDAMDGNLQLLTIYYAEMLQRQVTDDARALAAINIATNFLNFCNNNPILRRHKTICLDYICNNNIPLWGELEYHNLPAPNA